MGYVLCSQLGLFNQSARSYAFTFYVSRWGWPNVRIFEPVNRNQTDMDVFLLRYLEVICDRLVFDTGHVLPAVALCRLGTCAVLQLNGG